MLSIDFWKGLVIGIVLSMVGAFLFLRFSPTVKFPPTNEATRARCIHECGVTASACDDNCAGDQGCMDRCTDRWNRCIWDCRS